MTVDDYRRPPDAAGMAAAERTIRRAGLVSLAAFLAAAFLAVLVLPAFFVFPEALDARLAFAALAALLVLVWVVVGIGLVSTARRTSPEDIGGAAAGPPSPRIAIRAAFLQNTLEQAVVASGLCFALAVLVEGRWLAALIPAIAFFAIGRVLFLRNYRHGVRARALGMTLTMAPVIVGYPLALVLIARRIVIG